MRAGGAYGIIPEIRKIVAKHAENTNPDDAVFLEFSRLVVKKSIKLGEYERLQLAVLEIVPRPFGMVWSKSAPPDPLPGPYPESEPKKKRPKKRCIVSCGICGEPGHNARGCANKPDTSVVKHTDGVERLTPGFDPNPPKKVDEEKEST